ncbi:MAG: UDP-2,3-diacylglucosamine diphosphatase [Rhizobiales bacterium]|nr:UDP-2,3-diacylglucosamine diphosphatase [Hyphomicrobiales bacterium]
MPSLPPRQVRTLFVSDLHLGLRGCQAALFLDFLQHHEADTIVLVGDIVDGWQLRRAWYWPQSHNDVVQKLLRRARKGTRLVYLPGNHDEFMRDYLGTLFGAIEITDRLIHETADGRRFLVLHGDQFDVVMHYAPWLAMLGAQAYSLMLAANGAISWARRRLGISYWSLAHWAKRSVKNAVKVIGTYEAALVAEARRCGVDGIICGHIHHAEMREVDGVAYVNTGDWVESGTAIVEHHDGQLELIHWAAEGRPAEPGPDISDDDLPMLTEPPGRDLVAAFIALEGRTP